MIRKQLEMFKKVSKEDVMRVYEKYIKNKPAVIESVVARGKEDLKAAADNYVVDTTHYRRPDYGYSSLHYKKPKDNFDRSAIPPSGPNPVVKVPEFWKTTLKNGIKVIGTENHEIPTVTVSISLKGGRLLEQQDLTRAGITSLLAAMMDEDTKNKTSEDMSQALEKLGSSINIGSSTDAMVFTVQSPSKNLEKTLDLLQERMFQPDFKEETFNRLKRQLGEGIKNARTQASAVADAVYNRVNYGNKNILGLPVRGTEETIKNIKLQDLTDFYNNYISSQNAEVVIVGDVKENQVIPSLSFLEKLPNKDVALPTLPQALNAISNRIYLVDIPNAAQTEFRVGNVNDLRYDVTGNYYRATLSNYNLGGGFNSRLNINLREDKGWTYGARSSFNADKYTGGYTFSSGILAKATDSALAEVIREIKLYHNNGVKPTELEFMKKSIGQSDARNYETGVQKAAFIGRILRYNLPSDFVLQQTKILNSFTVDEANTLIRRYIDLGKMNIVLVGDKDRILPGLLRMKYDIVELDANGDPVGEKQ
jgi:zinc protease